MVFISVRQDTPNGGSVLAQLAAEDDKRARPEVTDEERSGGRAKSK